MCSLNELGGRTCSANSMFDKLHVVEQRLSYVSVAFYYLNSRPQLRHLFGSFISRNKSDSKQVNGAPITATSIAHSGTVPLITLVELHRAHSFAGTTRRAIGCGVG